MSALQDTEDLDYFKINESLLYMPPKVEKVVSDEARSRNRAQKEAIKI